MDRRMFLVTVKISSSRLACPLHVLKVQLAQHSWLTVLSSVPTGETLPWICPRVSHTLQSGNNPIPLDFSDRPPRLFLTSVPCFLSFWDFSSPVGLKQKWVHPQSMCLSSQVLQVWIKWPNLFGIHWAVTQGHVHSGMSLIRADAASARSAKGPWLWFPVRGWGVGQSLPSMTVPPSPLFYHHFALIMNSSRNFYSQFQLDSSQFEISHLVCNCKFKRLKIAAFINKGLFYFWG